MKSILLPLIFGSVLFCGCFNIVQKNAGLSEKQISSTRIRSLKQFEGIYKDNPQGNGPRLSQIIFRDSPPVADSISCKVVDDSQIQVQALSNNQVIKEKALYLDKDFKISFSKIPIESKNKASSYHGGDDSAWFTPPFSGVAHFSGELYLNQAGDIIYHTSTQAAFLVLHSIPVAANQNGYAAYKRLK